MVSGSDDVGLNGEVFGEEVRRSVAVRDDAANAACGEQNILGLLILEKYIYCSGIGEIELGPSARDDLRAAAGPQHAHQG